MLYSKRWKKEQKKKDRKGKRWKKKCLQTGAQMAKDGAKKPKKAQTTQIVAQMAKKVAQHAQKTIPAVGQLTATAISSAATAGHQ